MSIPSRFYKDDGEDNKVVDAVEKDRAGYRMAADSDGGQHEADAEENRERDPGVGDLPGVQ